MSVYNFFIEVYFTQNDTIEIKEKEKELFTYENKKIKIVSLDDKEIYKSKGIRLECGTFDNIQECIDISKKVYINFLIALNNTCISYFLDKELKGNFKKYCTEDSELYKEIIINDLEEKNDNIHIVLERGGGRCTHFRFNKLLDLKMDKKLKDSLKINNYRKYLNNDKMNSYIDNTLYSASLEMLLEKKERDSNEIEIIEEVCRFLDERYYKTKNQSYNSIKTMIMNNKHKSINSQKEYLIKRYTNKEDFKQNINIIKEISKNRTREIHKSSNEDIKRIYNYSVLNKIQLEYAKDLYKKK